jgi:hypothetical protein
MRQEIMAKFQRCRHFGGGYIAALRINAAENMTDGAVFACGIHALQNEENRMLSFSVENFRK